MKLPWDKHYLKISFHVIFTVVALLVLGLLITNFVDAVSFVGGVAGGILSLMSPLIIAFVTAYLLDPVVDFFQKQFESLVGGWRSTKKPRNKKAARRDKSDEQRNRVSGTALTYLFVLIILLIIGRVLFNGLGSMTDIDGIAGSITSYVNDLDDLRTKLEVNLAELGVLEQVTGYIDELVEAIVGYVKSISTNIVGAMTKAGGGILNFMLGVIIAFYLLKDKHIILRSINKLIDTFIPQKYSVKIRNGAEDVNIIFSGYIRGQLTDALIMSVLISVTLSIIGVKLAVVIGIISGISNLIPYFGAIIAFALAIIMSLMSGDPMKALYSAVAIVILQQIDGIFIVPKVVGEKVELHPAVVLLALSIAGASMGITGMILAVPVVAIFKLFLMRFIYRRQKLKKNKAI